MTTLLIGYAFGVCTCWIAYVLWLFNTYGDREHLDEHLRRTGYQPRFAPMSASTGDKAP
jgi:hypothetical protein